MIQQVQSNNNNNNFILQVTTNHEVDHSQKVIQQRKVKKNGFSSPLSLHQVVSWLIYVGEAIWVFYIFSNFFRQSQAQYIAYYVINGLFFILTFLFGFLASNCNPCDDLVVMQQKGHMQNTFNTDVFILDEQEKHFQCKICNLYVYPKTKHCGVCNKCVFEFDHHCQWLNNCVGKKNYRDFILFVGSILVNLIVNISYTCYSFYLHNYDSSTYIKRSETLLSFGIFFGLSIAILVINSVSLVFCIELLVYHSWLKYKGMTTYDHIVKIRKQSEASIKIDLQRKKQMEIKQKQDVIIENQQNKNNLEYQKKQDETNLPFQLVDIIATQKDDTNSRNISNNLNQAEPANIQEVQNAQIHVQNTQIIQEEDYSLNQDKNYQMNQQILSKVSKQEYSIDNDTQNEIERQNGDQLTQQTHLDIVDQNALYFINSQVNPSIIADKVIINGMAMHKSNSEACFQKQFKPNTIQINSKQLSNGSQIPRIQSANNKSSGKKQDLNCQKNQQKSQKYNNNSSKIIPLIENQQQNIQIDQTNQNQQFIFQTPQYKIKKQTFF